MYNILQMSVPAEAAYMGKTLFRKKSHIITQEIECDRALYYLSVTTRNFSETLIKMENTI